MKSLFDQPVNRWIYHSAMILAVAAILWIAISVVIATGSLLWFRDAWADWPEHFASATSGFFSRILGLITVATLWAAAQIHWKKGAPEKEEPSSNRSAPLTVEAFLPEIDQPRWIVAPKWAIAHSCIGSVAIGTFLGGLTARIVLTMAPFLGSNASSFDLWRLLSVAGIPFLILAALIVRLFLSQNRDKASNLPPLVREQLTVLPKRAGVLLPMMIVSAAVTAVAAALAMPPNLRNHVVLCGAIALVVIFAFSPIVQRLEDRFRTKYGFALS